MTTTRAINDYGIPVKRRAYKMVTAYVAHLKTLEPRESASRSAPRRSCSRAVLSHSGSLRDRSASIRLRRHSCWSISIHCYVTLPRYEPSHRERQLSALDRPRNGGRLRDTDGDGHSPHSSRPFRLRSPVCRNQRYARPTRLSLRSLGREANAAGHSRPTRAQCIVWDLSPPASAFYVSRGTAPAARAACAAHPRRRHAER